MDDNVLVTRRQEQQLNRLRDAKLRRDMHERSVRNERGVQRAERSPFSRRVLAQMLADEIGLIPENLCQTVQANTVGQRRRKRALEKTVDKDETMARLTKQERPNVRQRRHTRRRLRQLKLCFSDRRDARETPRFLLHVGEA